MTGERFNEIRKRKYAEDRVVYTVFAGDKKATALNIVNDDEWFMAIALLNEVYETKEEAEWYCKMNKSRIEKFEPPMWEEIKGYYRFNFMNCENGAWKKYSFELLKKQDDKAKEGGYISIWTGTKDIYNKTTPTKENYEKACEMVGKLFGG